ncbi:MAG TPA: iron-containing redox enzyme family protein [Propionibacteriaceae bacterium]|nr:iron-containing redox enzyme family protein [Propionibacteriaceae bacterium]
MDPRSPVSPITARGPLSERLLERIAGGPGGRLLVRDPALERPPVDRVLEDDDLQLSLFLLYALAYGSLGPAGDSLEWDQELLGLRGELEDLHERALRRLVGDLPSPGPDLREIGSALFALTSADEGPSLSAYAARRASREQLRELLVLRAIYTLREADPHSWALPRLTGRPKAALVEVQSDEYGNGRPEAMHASLYADSMRAAGLSTDQLAYLDVVPPVTLAAHNTMSLFGLHRRLLGAIVGHLAAFEMTSSIPNRRYRDGYRRVGFGPDVTTYFAVHVQADAVHEQVAAYDLAGALAEQEPERIPDIMFGAASCLALDALLARRVLEAWQAGRSALRGPVHAAA